MNDLLPHDIIINILSRLPAKSLGQLMSVSKSWFSIISCPDFVQLHHNRSISDPHTNHFRILLSSTFSLNTIDYESPACYEDFNDQNVKAIVDHKFPLPDEFINKQWGSCYGLIYFVSYQECIFLWNPCTKLTRILPNSSTTTLLSDHAMSFYGLGYDSSTNDYKMVSFTRTVSGKLMKCEVYSLRNNESWRSVDVQTIDENINVSEQEKGMFSNGALHWQGNKGSEPYEKSIILSFDIREEKFGQIPLPDVGDEEMVFNCLGNIKGCLSLICGGVDRNDAHIWVMEEYGVGKSWRKLITISCVGFDCDYSLWPVCITRKGDVVVDLDGWNLEMFNMKEKTAKRFKKCSTDWHSFLMYMDCLVSPYG